MVQGGEKKGEREKGRKNNDCGKVGKGIQKRKMVQGVKRKKQRKIIYCGKVRKVETKKEK